MIQIQLSERQEKIIDIVKANEPITSENIAKTLKLTRATLRPDLAILTMSGILDARPKVGYFYTGKTTFSFISEKIQGIKVAERKSIPIIVDEQTSIYDGIVTIFLEDTSTIFVTSKGYLSGVVSRKDFLKNAIGGLNLTKTPIAVIMTRMPNIIVTAPEESVLDAAMKLIEHEIDSLPVVEEVILDEGDKAYKVVGRITKTTITRLFVELGNNE
ncbi:negative regulator of gluconeogenesis [[Clostridium] ultunense Esp]|uniref:Negative regulator of gluconeogenesis n=1 Tax=[Clostridium] ultunense Esp TaxID=1288971 RepID=M1ZG30_9FIRM|nr:helix-turn-helix transcriptional regulator [Schnuerera ultunensis]CCQ97369.1 negative regulator of gluconeogenesis [[Clostridium] ultunense Esp]SHD77419.1 negative regulator of gluconeogenesis [[Clostridium] ultunense Esp]